MKKMIVLKTITLFFYLLMLFLYVFNKEDIKNKANEINYSKHLTLD